MVIGYDEKRKTKSHRGKKMDRNDVYLKVSPLIFLVPFFFFLLILLIYFCGVLFWVLFDFFETFPNNQIACNFLTNSTHISVVFTRVVNLEETTPFQFRRPLSTGNEKLGNSLGPSVFKNTLISMNHCSCMIYFARLRCPHHHSP